MILFDILRRLFIPLFIPDYYSKTFIITSMMGFPFFFALVIDCILYYYYYLLIYIYIVPFTVYYSLTYCIIAILLTLIVLIFADTNIHQNHWIIISLIILVGFVNSIFLLWLVACELSIYYIYDLL